MSLRTFRTVMILLPALALAACGGSSMSDWLSGKPPAVDPNAAPTADYKNEILVTLQRTMDDPTNLREAQVSEPRLESFGGEQRYVSCVRFNGRDITKRYTGVQTHIAYFFGGHLNQVVAAQPGQCTTAAYRPFPELEKICPREKCT